MSIVVAAVAGGVGAAVRYGLSGFVQRSATGSFPVGTAAVNLAGALAVGLLAGLAAAEGLTYEVGVGFLGGFTTFSTWMVETAGLGILPRPRRGALLNLCGVLVLGVCLAGVGYTLTS